MLGLHGIGLKTGLVLKTAALWIGASASLPSCSRHAAILSRYEPALGWKPSPQDGAVSQTRFLWNRRWPGPSQCRSSSQPECFIWEDKANFSTGNSRVSGSTLRPPSVSFAEQDVALFSDASGDRNPLHLSPEYARRTPYGQPVVFGCLGALACLGQFCLPAGWSATSLQAQFRGPLFVSVTYRVETSEKDGKWSAWLFDGSTPVVSVTVTAAPSGRSETLEEVPAESTFERYDAVARRKEDIVPGLEISGLYACNPVALTTLAARWDAWESAPRDVALLEQLSSRDGASRRVRSFLQAILNFPRTDTCPATMRYCASIVSVDSRFDQIAMDVSLLSAGSIVASGQFCSFLRLPVPGVEDIDSTDVRPDSLTGRVAVLLGSSRGLGAAMKQALELRGAAVYGMARSANTRELSRIEVGDAADVEALRRLRQRVLGEQGRLDFLICNACPPVCPCAWSRTRPHASQPTFKQAVSLTLAPLAEFLRSVVTAATVAP